MYPQQMFIRPTRIVYDSLFFVRGDDHMPKLITFSCFMLFWVFYEMSGGAAFEPQERVVHSQAPFSKPGTQNLTYQRPIAAAQVMTASYVPVTTEPLVAISVAPTMQQETPVIAPAPAAEPEIEAPQRDFRFVAGNRVNLRRGPGTAHQVVETLPFGTTAEVIVTNDQGWAQIRLTESGKTGWMATRLLSEG
jgi:hypothetical protein